MRVALLSARVLQMGHDAGVAADRVWMPRQPKKAATGGAFRNGRASFRSISVSATPVGIEGRAEGTSCW